MQWKRRTMNREKFMFALLSNLSQNNLLTIACVKSKSVVLDMIVLKILKCRSVSLREGEEWGRGHIFLAWCAIGVIIFLFCWEGGQNVLLLFAMNLASPLPGINNEWSLIGGRTACVVRMVTGCFCNQLLFRNYFVLCRKRCLCLIQSANSQSAASPNN